MNNWGIHPHLQCEYVWVWLPLHSPWSLPWRQLAHWQDVVCSSLGLALPPHWLLTHSTYLTPLSLFPCACGCLLEAPRAAHFPSFLSDTMNLLSLDFYCSKNKPSTFWHLSLFERWDCMCTSCWFPELSSYSPCSLTSTPTSFLFSSISSTATIAARCSINTKYSAKIILQDICWTVPTSLC